MSADLDPNQRLDPKDLPPGVTKIQGGYTVEIKPVSPEEIAKQRAELIKAAPNNAFVDYLHDLLG